MKITLRLVGISLVDLFFHLCDAVCVLGEITTTALLDREQKSEFILIVRAVDGGVGPQQKTGIATVTTSQPSLD